MRASVALALLWACSPTASGPGTLTVGVDGQALGSYIQSLHVVTTVDGTTETDAVFRASQGPVFPHEVKIDARGDVAAKVGVRVEGFATDDPSASPPAIIRTAETTMEPAPWNKLLRVDLDTLCVLVPPHGGVVGPS